MRVEHYCHELPEFGITVYGGLAALGSISTEELDDRMANWRPALFHCAELVDSLGQPDYAPIRMTHSPRNNQLEPYPDLSVPLRITPMLMTPCSLILSYIIGRSFSVSVRTGNWWDSRFTRRPYSYSTI